MAGATVWMLSCGDDRSGGDYASKTDAEIAELRKGGGGTIRAVTK